MFSHRHFIWGFVGVAFSVVSIAPSTFILGSNAAFAKNDGDHGNGGGNDHDNGGGNGNASNDHGNGNGNDKASGHGGGNGNGGSVQTESATVSHGKSDSAPGQSKPATGPGSRVVNFFKGLTTEPAPAPVKTKSLDSQIASLHAANANLQAFIHASPNSKVGQIAAYAKAEVAVETAQAALAAAQTAAATASATLTAAQTARATDVAVLTAPPYSLTDTTDAGLQTQLATLTAVTMPTAQQTAEIAAINQALADSAAVAAAQVAVDTAATAIATATTDLATAQTTATTALDAAANDNRTPVDPAVQAWVDAQLAANGVLDYFRQQAAATTTATATP
jgi:hypothetical protein